MDRGLDVCVLGNGKEVHRYMHRYKDSVSCITFCYHSSFHKLSSGKTFSKIANPTIKMTDLERIIKSRIFRTPQIVQLWPSSAYKWRSSGGSFKDFRTPPLRLAQEERQEPTQKSFVLAPLARSHEDPDEDFRFWCAGDGNIPAQGAVDTQVLKKSVH